MPKDLATHTQLQEQNLICRDFTDRIYLQGQRRQFQKKHIGELDLKVPGLLNQ